jgi:predicted ATPase
VAAVRGRLLQPEVRLLTLTGAPGIGKTRLALAAAAALQDAVPGGACFVPLAHLSGPALVAAAMAARLGVREPDGETLPDRAAPWNAPWNAFATPRG